MIRVLDRAKLIYNTTLWIRRNFYKVSHIEQQVHEICEPDTSIRFLTNNGTVRAMGILSNYEVTV